MPRRILEDADTGLDREVTDAFQRALETIAAAGAELVDIELPHAAYAVPAYYLVAPAEASSNLARYDGVRYGARAPVDAGDAGDAANGSEATPLSRMYDRTRNAGFGAEAKRRIMLGTYALSHGYYDAYYLRAQRVRRLIRKDYETVFGGDSGRAGVHAVAMPTTPTPAFRLGERVEDPLAMYLGDVFTVSANLAGIAGDQRPRRADPRTVAIGLQLTGRAFDESTLLRLATFTRARGRAVAFLYVPAEAGARSPVTKDGLSRCSRSSGVRS